MNISDLRNRLLTDVTSEEWPGLLDELDSAGFFSLPEESPEQFAQRLLLLFGELEKLRSGSSVLGQRIAGLLPLPGKSIRESADLTWAKYRFRAEWIPVWFSSRETGCFSAGILLEVDRILPLIFLHGTFARKQTRMGYDAQETLAHEMIHGVRTAFPESAYDEYFPWQISRSGFRRALGNLFRKWILPFLFFGGMALSGILAALKAAFPENVSAGTALVPLILPLGVVIRERILMRRMAKAARNLRLAGLEAEPLLLRLSDREIFKIAAADSPGDILLKGNESIRWKMLLKKFRMKDTSNP